MISLPGSVLPELAELRNSVANQHDREREPESEIDCFKQPHNAPTLAQNPEKARITLV
jgi:hypothetical protein